MSDEMHDAAPSAMNVPSPDARRWIARAMELQYGSDAPATDYARKLWRRSVEASNRTRPADRRSRRPDLSQT